MRTLPYPKVTQHTCFVCELTIKPSERLYARKAMIGGEGIPVRLRHEHCPHPLPSGSK